MSAVHPRFSDDEVKGHIVAAAESCEDALRHEAICVAAGDFLNAATMADVAEWDAVRSFAMAERFWGVS